MHNQKVSILCVDDETFILNALNRILKREQFELHFCDNAHDALELLDEYAIDIVITDMRMPAMSGDELLEKINDQWPHIKKVLLSGYAEKQALTTAINAGGVDHYLEKPWNNESLLAQIICMAQEVIMGRYEQNKNSSDDQQLTSNDVTPILSDSKRLEREMRSKEYNCDGTLLLRSVVKAHPLLNNVFASNVAITLKSLAISMEFSSSRTNDLETAGYLCELGLIGLDADVHKPFKTLTKNMQSKYLSQTAAVTSMLCDVPSLVTIRDILVEQFKPLSSKPCFESLILAVVRDFWRMRMGMWQTDKLTEQTAKQELYRFKGIRYDDAAVHYFFNWLEKSKIQLDCLQSAYQVGDLKDGMILQADIKNCSGMLLLRKGHVVTHTCIEKLKKAELGSEDSLKIVGVEQAN